MEYLEAVNLLHEIEDRYDVMSIKSKGIEIWPYLRIYLFDSIYVHRAQDVSVSSLKQVCKDLFFFNPLRFFNKYDVWNFSSRITRKKIGQYFEHHVSGALHKGYRKVLTLEDPANNGMVIRRRDIPEKNIVSNSWFNLVYGLIFVILRCLPLKIENEDIIRNIIQDYHIDFNYRKRVKMLYAQRKASDFFFAISFKPRLIIMECSYTQMGRVWSAHKRGIPVIELQHGVINGNHYAYNPRYSSKMLYPDEICVYGEEEYKYFQKGGRQFAPKVSMTGLYILDRMEEAFSDDIFAEYRDKYESVIVFAGQVGGEGWLSSFADSLAKEMQQVMFIYIPRHKSDFIHFTQTNVKYVFGVNIYEYLKWCDIHATISSTTGLEAHYFHKPVIFCDYKGVAKQYYGEILKNENGARYITTVQEFIDNYNELKGKNFVWKEIFAHNHLERITKVIDSYLGI